MNAYAQVLLLALACAAASANQTTSTDEEHNPSNIIANGYAAYQGKAPYIVSLLLQNYDETPVDICSGVIISYDYVLTAAQCLRTEVVEVHFGAISRGNGQPNFKAYEYDFIRHENWPIFGYDIGLIRTPYVEFSATVNKINLPRLSQKNERFENWWATACGWGKLANGQTADRLQCVDLQIITNNECYESYGVLPSSIVCARTTSGKSTCSGDTGGPLVAHDEPVLVGLTSFNSADGCTFGKPAGFIRITSHLDWIQSNTGISYE
ncbi:hypothetical protein AWZ03_000772 [Drosophila navojoa]|uniref:trypsin n=1 Tax=Drosophila navojoa TaxID=7232 RepID=A0A484BUQ6_DRONA|nr:hypothetical protein AWZ03_000772 [Drosophila navojoa]